MLEDVTNNLKKSIEFAKSYCAKNQMILVRVDVPPNIYSVIKQSCYYSNSMSNNNISHFDIEQFAGVSIGINRNVKKPQYIMEMEGY